MNNNLNLKQVVRSFTRKQEILDILLTNLFPFYNSPVIIPPVQPDVPGQGVPSDHSVPLCVPHTDPNNPPKREYKTIISRPLPDSIICEFGQWLATEPWDFITEEEDPSKKVKVLEEVFSQKLDDYFPQKVTKLGLSDKPFVTSELKNLKRKRMREYKKHGKSQKYLKLLKEFSDKFEKCSESLLRKNSLKETNPGQEYQIFEKNGIPTRGI